MSRTNTTRASVKVSSCDRDLGDLGWRLHEKGYAYKRISEIDRYGKVKRVMVWLHREVAFRMIVSGGGERRPAWVKFRNGNRTDCRRKNLIIVRLEEPRKP